MQSGSDMELEDRVNPPGVGATSTCFIPPRAGAGEPHSSADERS